MSSGIYILKNKINDNVYVGQTLSFDKRLSYHKKDLINDSHHQFNLQKEFNSFVEEEMKKNKKNKFYNYINFKDYVFDTFYEMEVIEKISKEKMCDKDYVLDVEDKYILKYRELNEGYRQKTNNEIKNNMVIKKAEECNLSEKNETEKKIRQYKEKTLVPREIGILINNDDTQFEVDYKEYYEEINKSRTFGYDCLYNYLYYKNTDREKVLDIELNIEEFKEYISTYFRREDVSNHGYNRTNIIDSLKALKLSKIKTLTKVTSINLKVDFVELDKAMFNILKLYNLNMKSVPNTSFDETFNYKLDKYKEKIDDYNNLLETIDNENKPIRDLLMRIISDFLLNNNIMSLDYTQQKELNNLIPFDYRCRTLYQTLKKYGFKIEYTNFKNGDMFINEKDIDYTQINFYNSFVEFIELLKTEEDKDKKMEMKNKLQEEYNLPPLTFLSNHYFFNKFLL